MTGAHLCRLLLDQASIEAEVVRGAKNHYVHGERLVVLDGSCFVGTSRKHLTLAAHEVGHALQESRFGGIAPAARWLMIGRLLLEWDACRRARSLMLSAGHQPREDVLINIWHGYLVPAIWQTGLMAAILAAWLVFR